MSYTFTEDAVEGTEFASRKLVRKRVPFHDLDNLLKHTSLTSSGKRRIKNPQPGSGRSFRGYDRRGTTHKF